MFQSTYAFRFISVFIFLCAFPLLAHENSLSLADPYLWLEDSQNLRTQKWLRGQERLFNQYIQPHSDQRAQLKAQLANLLHYELYSVPTQLGDHYFFKCRLPSEQQAVLYVQEGLNGTPRVLVDPNAFSKSAYISLVDYVPSPNGHYLAYALAESGSDWVTWRVLNIATGEHQIDQLERIKFFPVAWNPDSSGFYYSRLDQDDIFRIYYHQLGTSQESDQHIHQSFEGNEFYFFPSISSDDQFLLIIISKGSSGPNAIIYRDLKNSQAGFVTLIPLDGSHYSYLCNEGEHFYFWTDHDAPLGKVIAIDKTTGISHDVIKERKETLRRVIPLKNSFMAIYMKDVVSRLFLFDRKGKKVKEIALPEMGTLSFGEIGETAENGECFFSFTHFFQPPLIYHYSLTADQLQIFKKPTIRFNPQDYVARQAFYPSKDGTEVPLFIVHRKDLPLEEQHQTLLYGYGGFNIAMTPFYSALHMAWIENGGIFALANIRGGSEYGEEWHRGGMLKNKQNCFDDFIAAAEWLITNQYTSSSKLAIRGASNGGLLVAVCLNQRPELFGAAVVGVGLLDMIRFPLFTAGRYWIPEYGNPQNPEDFALLARYSPYHNVQKGIQYPPTLITTANHDDRVVPLHSYKYAAAMQKAQRGKGKILLRVDRQAGHGAGKSTSQLMEEAVDTLLFLKSELK